MAQAFAIVDFAHEVEPGGFERGKAEVEAEFGLAIEVLQECGPGGGWPEVKLVGEREAIERALKANWGYDEQDLEELGLVEEA